MSDIEKALVELHEHRYSPRLHRCRCGWPGPAHEHADHIIAAILATEPMQAIALYAAIGEVVMLRAERLHEPPGCKWHDHGPEMHIEDAELRDAAFAAIDAALTEDNK